MILLNIMFGISQNLPYIIFMSIGALLGLGIGIYGFYKFEDILSYFKVANKPKKIIKYIVAILLFLSCLSFRSLSCIIAIHFALAFIFVDIIGFIYGLIFRNKEETKESLENKKDTKPLKFIPKLQKSGILAIAIFLILIISGIYGINHIEETDYYLNSDKINESYTILFISDTHYDTIQDNQLFKNEIKNMNNLKPDIVILGGDLVDDGTPEESMKELFSEIKKINSTYGTYYIYGNHDRTMRISSQNSSQTESQNDKFIFNDGELNKTIKENGIKILCDDKVTINNEIILIGREDKGFSANSGRLSSEQLLNNIDLSKYIIIADHQPAESKKNAKLGADLQVSGHTHGGQIFPLNIIYSLAGTLNYGEYKFGKMSQITSSGVAGWGWPLKNANPCEYVVIHIN